MCVCVIHCISLLGAWGLVVFSIHLTFLANLYDISVGLIAVAYMKGDKEDAVFFIPSGKDNLLFMGK